MKLIILIFLTIIACGKEDKEKIPEPKDLNIDSVHLTTLNDFLDDSGSVKITPIYSAAVTQEQLVTYGWVSVINIATDDYPEHCDKKTGESAKGTSLVSIENLTHGEYYLRACAAKQDESYMSRGITKKFTIKIDQSAIDMMEADREYEESLDF